jgi:molybdopterin synthase catalytic subunit
MIRITDQPIDTTEVIKAASGTGAGAMNVFIGTVRDTALDKKVIRLEYEAYESMAVSETQKIVEEAAKKWDLLGVAISHRVGNLAPGEIAVVVAVATKHRKASFEACQFIIDTLKQKVPIFKKEVFEDGSEWISALNEKQKTPR